MSSVMLHSPHRSPMNWQYLSKWKPAISRLAGKSFMQGDGHLSTNTNTSAESISKADHHSTN
jgi:hypothetical protein